MRAAGPALRERGVDVVATVEPGGTPLGGELRRLLLDGGALDARAEALLMAADRAEHVAGWSGRRWLGARGS